ncbi:nucleotidyltransferase family protein [Pseudanabaena sp. PCC 6802]|uniref:nucleotidyltransferase family protein n=1 Tax=Pseudanabaena sp. PCC 6802 TaxID=118173 RepID=UPI000345F1A0|nr:nucleotidyltransferase domain-containing protein [Pseudanabaena sp. PCC 6802]
MDILSVKPEIYTRLLIKPEQLKEFCQRRHIAELALFGSILRDDFHLDSDIDILVRFQADIRVSLLDLVDMQYELEALFHRKVDLSTKKSVVNGPNWIRRQEILSTAQIITD